MTVGANMLATAVAGSGGSTGATGSTAEVASYFSGLVGQLQSSTAIHYANSTVARIVPTVTPNSVTINVVLANEHELTGSSTKEILSYLNEIAMALPSGSIQRANLQTIMDTIEAMSIELAELRCDMDG